MGWEINATPGSLYPKETDPVLFFFFAEDTWLFYQPKRKQNSLISAIYNYFLFILTAWLMVVSLPKHVVKIQIKYILVCLTETRDYFVFIYTWFTLCG